MQFKQIAAVAAFAGLANAQSECASLVTSIPACALGYIAGDAFSKYSCGLVDFECDCAHTSMIENDIGLSIINAPNCDINAVLDGASALCGCAASFTSSTIQLNSIQSQCQPSAAAIPACGLGFIAETALMSFSCSVQDFGCQCSHFSDLASLAASDVSAACGSTDAVIASANALCSCVSGGAGSAPTGVTATSTPVGGPTSSPTASVGSGVTGTTSPVATGSSPVVSGSGTGSASVPGGSSPSGSGKGSVSVPGGSSPSGSGKGSVSSPGGGSPTTANTTPAPKQTSSGHGTVPLPTFTGAGATASAFGGVMGVLAGIVAFL